VLEHCCEGETNWWISIFWAFPSDRNLKARKNISVYFIFIAAITVNYSNQFWEFFEATTLVKACSITLGIYYTLSIIWDDKNEEPKALP
jgi:hypothetical protein